MHIIRNNKLIIALILLLSVTGFGLYAVYQSSENIKNSKETVSKGATQEETPDQAVIDKNDAVKSGQDAAHLDLDGAFQRIVQKELPKQQQSVASSLSYHLDDTHDLLQKIQQVQSGEADNLRGLIDSKTYELNVIKEEVAKELHYNLASLEQESEQYKSLKDYEAQVTQRFERVHNLLKSVVKSKNNETLQAAVSSASNYLSTLKKPEPKFIEPEPTFRLPETIKLPESKRAAPPAYSLYARNLPMMLAATGDLASLGIVQPTVEDPEAQNCDYTAVDLDPAAPEIVFDQKILDLAQKLEYNPLKIYEYVANNITYQAYFGSLKGATATLVSGAGNATDQASLLIALLRVSKIPARYVRGQIGFAIDDPRGFNWVGAKALDGFLQIAPSAWRNTGSTNYGMLKHTWVEACVPYDNYRGSRADVSGYSWIPLDPSYEQYDYVQGTTVPQAFDLNDFFYGANGYMLKRSLQLPHEAFEQRLTDTLGKTIDPVGYHGTKSLVKHDILPSTLPYEVYSFEQWGDGITSAETAVLPQDHRYVFSLSVKNSANTVIHPQVDVNLADIALKRVTLRFEGATQAQVDDTSCAANPSVTPVISIEGVDQVIAGKLAVGLCTSNNRLAMTIRLGTQTINQVEYFNIGAHNYHSLQGYALQASSQLIAERSNALLTSVGQINDPNTLQEETLGEFLHLAGLKYMDYITKANVRIGALYDGYGILGKHLGLTSTRKSVSYLFDLPYGISGNGFLIDVIGGQGGVRNLSTGQNSPDAFLLSGYTSSAYESYIWQEMTHLDAVSSVTGIQHANETANPVVTLTTADILSKPWATIALASQLSYACPDAGTHPYPNGSPSAYTHILDSNFTPLNLFKLSGADTEKNSVKGLYRFNGVSFPEPLTFNWSDGFSVNCPLTTPASQLPRNYLNDADALAGYPQDTLKHIAESALAGKTVNIPQKRIQFDNWLGSVYIVADSSSATFAISGDYTAGGGYTTAPVSYEYNQGSLPTGVVGILQDPVHLDLYYGGTSTVELPNTSPGTAGANTGVTDYSTMSIDPVNLVSGNMYLPELDFHIKGAGSGLDIVFKRHYNSNMRKDGSLGFGWTHSLNHMLKFYDDNSDGKTNKVIWVDGSGVTRNFDVAGSTSGIATNQVLNNPTGIYVTAKRESTGEYSIREKNGLTFYFENMAGSHGTTAKLLRVVDRNDNTIHLGYDGAGKLEAVWDGPGRTINFYYDNADQHITRISDWSGRTWRYTYSNNNLIKFETPLAIEGKETASTYSYYVVSDGTNLDHAMQSYSRPSGKTMTFEYYTNGKVFRHTDDQGNSFTFRYNEFRRETVTVDEAGIKQSYLFNEYGQQLLHIQGDGSQLAYEYNDSTYPLNETLRRHALGYETQYQYDNKGNPVKTILPDNSTIQSLGLNSFNLPCTLRDNNGNYTLNRYDGKGNLTDVIKLKKFTVLAPADESSCTYTPPINTILSWQINTYNSSGHLLSSKKVRDFTTKQGPYAEYGYDAQFNPVTVKRCGLQHNSSGVIENRCVQASQQFDELGRALKIVDGNFYPVSMEYDANGRLVRTTDALNQWHDLRYDDKGRLIAESMKGPRSDGQIDFLLNNSIAYDIMDRPVATSNLAGFTTRTEYDAIGNVIRITNPDGYAVRFEYDKLSRPVRAFDEHGHAVSTQYDIGGRPVKVTDPNGNSTLYSYYGAEENGRLQKVTMADNRTLEYFYDKNGNVALTRDNLGRENLTEYDALNRPVRSVGPVFNGYGLNSIRQVTTSIYNELGDVLKIQAGYTTDLFGQAGSDVLQDQALYDYDDFGRLLSETDANGKVKRYYYDDHNNLVRTEMPNGHILELGYDHSRNGLLISKSAKLSAADSNPTATQYAYDALGQTVSVTTPDISYSYEHDSSGRLVKVTDSRGNKSLNYDFSPGGLLNSISDSDNKRSNFLYDAASRLTAITAPNGERVNMVFDAGGRLLESNIANGVSSRYSYDAANNLMSLVNRTSQGVISQHDYTYDLGGRRATHAETIDSTTTNYTWQYNELDQLTKVLKDGTTLVEEYAYDAYGNRRTKGNGTSVEHYLYDSAQQLLSIRSGSDTGTEIGTFLYDDNGNLTAKTLNGSTRNFTYDAQERLVQVTGNDITTETYVYDDQGRRIEKNVGAAKSQYLYSGLSIFAEFGADWGAALAHYTYTGLDQAIIRSAADPADNRYYHHDGLGSVVAVSDSAGLTQGSARYDVWGKVIAGSGNVPLYGFTGREGDATGLAYYRARYYDPGLGRFTQRDPLGFADGINPYVYVGSSPSNFTDPLGLAKITPSLGFNDSYDGTVAGWNNCSMCHPYEKSQNGNGLGNATSIASTALAGFDVANTAAMCQSGVCFDKWQGANGKWYNLGWGGNQWTGARGNVLSNMESFKLVGKTLTVASVVVEGVEMTHALSTGDNIGVVDSGVDLMMIAPTVLGGPVGFGLGVGYTGIDNTIGFDTFSGPITDLMCSATGNC